VGGSGWGGGGEVEWGEGRGRGGRYERRQKEWADQSAAGDV
jgi:hypothetical protein